MKTLAILMGLALMAFCLPASAEVLSDSQLAEIYAEGLILGGGGGVSGNGGGGGLHAMTFAELVLSNVAAMVTVGTNGDINGDIDNDNTINMIGDLPNPFNDNITMNNIGAMVTVGTNGDIGSTSSISNTNLVTIHK